MTSQVSVEILDLQPTSRDGKRWNCKAKGQREVLGLIRWKRPTLDIRLAFVYVVQRRC